MSPNLRPVWLLLALAAVCVLGRAAPAAARPLEVCLVSGSLEYESNASLAALHEYLESHYNVHCTRAFIQGEDETQLPGLENLDHCDVMLLFTRRLKLTGDDLARIKNYCLSGRPLVGVRTASHAIQTWLDLDKEVLGGNYQGHYRNDLPSEIAVVDGAGDDPLLAGFEPFTTAGSLYKNQGLADDCRVLMTATSAEATEPITWTRSYKGGRVFYTSLGHQRDFQEESFRRLLANALFWAAGRPLEKASANQ